jgi:hypothetical protein
MRAIATLFIAAGASLVQAGSPVMATPQARDVAPIEISSQATTVERRRPRIRVTPRYPRRNTVTLYALPYGIDYPGPRAVRQCVSRLVPEYRPSGTVIVPRTRCWWQHY